ncbi:ABC transporter permease [Cohnella lubricantis]|uniref:ABC transporter permease n=1 Tax=Cohnella lubricantis TaxID=2163172 RepID=A0A841TBV5_9BACL|nr:ABC transporter permease [Cohnella lubricantis]MBB6675921.1 ABC transporter permease [Cohnella lubricantis]MBP2117162.1 osmoprotectant transport system permease protein [Cohnella lubricantis]
MWADYLEFWRDRYPDLLTAAREHLTISAVAILLGVLVAVPLGIYLSGNRKKWVHSVIFTIANLFQTIPSLALLALLIPLLGIGVKPAIFALFLYSLLPILRNTYAGFQSVDPSILESARGMGYSRTQQLLQIQLPLAFPYIMSGIRLTTVYVISWTTLAALIGAGGLGQLIVSGIGVNRTELIVSAAACAIVLALLADRLLGALEKHLSKRARTSKSEASLI